MKPILTAFSVLTIILWGAPLRAQAPATSHEGYPVLKASELLKPEVLKGPCHTDLLASGARASGS